MKAILLFGVSCAAQIAFAQFSGLSSSKPAYYLPKLAGGSTTAILTAGDTSNGYPLLGSPDGMGAIRVRNTIELFVNHEIVSNAGVLHAHGAGGAFVSTWTFNATTLQVTNGYDLFQKVIPGSGLAPFARFCSGNLAEPYAFFNPASNLGTRQRIYMTGEEVGPSGRAIASIATGKLKGNVTTLPALGRMNMENAVPYTFPRDNTVVALTDDLSTGQVYFYDGMKRSFGNDFEKAGLTNGSFYGLKLLDVLTEVSSTGLSPTRFSLVNLGNITSLSGVDLETLSLNNQVTTLMRPEDFAWDPTQENVGFFNTTGANGVGCKLWRITFRDMGNIAAGGYIEAMVSEANGVRALDNLAVDHHGNVVMQEDPGTDTRLSKIWHFNPNTRVLRLVAEADPAYFLTPGPEFLTTNEESSGIIDASQLLGDGWYIFNVQAHYTHPNPAIIEGGQLLALYVP